MGNAAAPVPQIRPISDLRTNLNDVVDAARSSREPIFMTKNGAPCLVVLDCKAYEEQRLHDRFVLKLREAEIEERYQHGTISQEQLDARMRSIFSGWSNQSC